MALKVGDEVIVTFKGKRWRGVVKDTRSDGVLVKAEGSTREEWMHTSYVAKAQDRRAADTVGDYVVTWTTRDYKDQRKVFKNDPQGAPNNAEAKARAFARKLESDDDAKKYRNIRGRITVKAEDSHRRAAAHRALDAVLNARAKDGNGDDYEACVALAKPGAHVVLESGYGAKGGNAGQDFIRLSADAGARIVEKRGSDIWVDLDTPHRLGKRWKFPIMAIKISGQAQDAKAPFLENRAMSELAIKVQSIWRAMPNTEEGVAAAKIKMREAIAASGVTPEKLADYVTKMATSQGRRLNVNHIKGLARDSMRTTRHEFKGAEGGRCEVCGKPRSDAVHRGFGDAKDMRTRPSNVVNACPYCDKDHDPSNQCRLMPVSERGQVSPTGPRPPKKFARDAGGTVYVKNRVYADEYQPGENWSNSERWLDVGTELTAVYQTDKGVMFKASNGKQYHIDFYDCDKNLAKRKPTRDAKALDVASGDRVQWKDPWKGGIAHTGTVLTKALRQENNGMNGGFWVRRDHDGQKWIVHEDRLGPIKGAKDSDLEPRLSNRARP